MNNHRKQRKFALDVMHDLRQAYEDALLCFYAHDDGHRCSFKHQELLDRLEKIKAKLEDYKNV